MDSLNEDCNELKRKYDDCFNTWFSTKFLRGETDDSMCAPIFKVYQECVRRAMLEHKIEMREIDADFATGDYNDKPNNSNNNKDKAKGEKNKS